MRFLVGEEVLDRLKLDRLFLGRVVSVNVGAMTVDVVLQETGTLVKEVPIPVVYVSGTVNSGIIAVPRVGDNVYVGLRQDEWVCIGFALSSVIVDKYEYVTAWSRMMESADKGDGGVGAKPPKLNEGDFAVFIHDGDKNVDFVMTTSGYIMLSAGLSSLFMSQEDMSISEVARKKMEVYPMFGKVEVGQAEMKTVNGMEVPVPGEFRWRVDNEESLLGKTSVGKMILELGYIVDENTGMPKVSSVGGRVRFRLKIGMFELIIDEGGHIDIVGLSGVSMLQGITKITQNLSDVVRSVNNIVERIGSQRRNIGTSEESIGVENLVVQTGSVSVGNLIFNTNTGSFRLAGDIPFVLSTILPILSFHEHKVVNVPMKGLIAVPSEQLNLPMLLLHASKFVRGA